MVKGILYTYDTICEPRIMSYDEIKSLQNFVHKVQMHSVYPSVCLSVCLAMSLHALYMHTCVFNDLKCSLLKAGPG